MRNRKPEKGQMIHARPQGRRELQKSGGSESPICPQFSGNSLFIAFLCDNFLDFPKSGGSADPSDPLVTTPLPGLQNYKLFIEMLVTHITWYHYFFRLTMYLFFQFTIFNNYLIEKLVGNTDFSSPIDFSLFCLRIQETMQQFFQSYCNTILAICILPVTPFSRVGTQKNSYGIQFSTNKEASRSFFIF